MMRKHGARGRIALVEDFVQVMMRVAQIKARADQSQDRPRRAGKLFFAPNRAPLLSQGDAILIDGAPFRVKKVEGWPYSCHVEVQVEEIIS